MSLDSKSPNEVAAYAVDWSGELASGVTITGSSWPTVEAGITKVSDTFSTSTATVIASGGTVGQTYSLLNRITTSDGQTLEQTIGIPVEDR